jgi:hypothetical protein
MEKGGFIPYGAILGSNRDGLPSVASCGFFWQRIANCRNLSPKCPRLSHLHFSSEEQRYREFFLTFSCFEVP